MRCGRCSLRKRVVGFVVAAASRMSAGGRCCLNAAYPRNADGLVAGADRGANDPCGNEGSRRRGAERECITAPVSARIPRGGYPGNIIAMVWHSPVSRAFPAPPPLARPSPRPCLPPPASRSEESKALRSRPPHASRLVALARQCGLADSSGAVCVSARPPPTWDLIAVQAVQRRLTARTRSFLCVDFC